MHAELSVGMFVSKFFNSWRRSEEDRGQVQKKFVGAGIGGADCALSIPRALLIAERYAPSLKLRGRSVSSSKQSTTVAAPTFETLNHQLKPKILNDTLVLILDLTKLHLKFLVSSLIYSCLNPFTTFRSPNQLIAKLVSQARIPSSTLLDPLLQPKYSAPCLNCSNSSHKQPTAR